MIRYVTIVLIAAGVLAAVQQEMRGQQPPAPNASKHAEQFHSLRDCGPVSLAMVCRLRGVKASVNKLREMTLKSAEGTTGAELMAAAKSFGLQAVGVQCSARTLAKKNCLAIIGLEDHFAVFVGVDQRTQKLLIVDVPRTPYFLTVEELEALWEGDGFAMLFPVIETKPKAKPEAVSGDPVVTLDPPLHSLGPIWEGEDRTCSFKIRNTGAAEVRILDVRACCGSKARVDKKLLPPNESAELTVTLPGRTGGSSPEDFTKTIMVITDAPEGRGRLVAAKVTGTTKPRVVVDPPRISLTATTATKVSDLNAQARIQFYDDAKATIQRVESSDAWLGARVLPATDGSSEGSAGTLRIAVAVKQRPPALGTNRATIVLHTTSKKRPTVELPVRLHVEGQYVVAPDHVYLGVRPPATALVRKLHVRKRLGGKDFAITKVTCSSAIGQAKGITEGIRGEHSLFLHITTPARHGRFSESAAIHLNNGQILRVPVTGFVREKTN